MSQGASGTLQSEFVVEILHLEFDSLEVWQIYQKVLKYLTK